jgi:putative hydrolase of the HAD superfamily
VEKAEGAKERVRAWVFLLPSCSTPFIRTDDPEESVTYLQPHIQAVFFDVVGTVLFPDPGAISIYTQVAQRDGLELQTPEIRARFIEAYNQEDLRDRDSGWITSEVREQERWRYIVTTTLRGVRDPERCFEELFAHFAQPSSWRLARDAGTVIAELTARGIVVGLGSNYDGRLWSVLEGSPVLSPLRERTIISSVVGFRKPSIEFFQNIVRVAGCEPRAVLFVGDDIENDYLGASAAGLEAILLDDKNQLGAANRIARLADLIGR